MGKPIVSYRFSQLERKIIVKHKKEENDEKDFFKSSTSSNGIY